MVGLVVADGLRVRSLGSLLSSGFGNSEDDSGVRSTSFQFYSRDLRQDSDLGVLRIYLTDKLPIRYIPVSLILFRILICTQIFSVKQE